MSLPRAAVFLRHRFLLVNARISAWIQTSLRAQGRQFLPPLSNDTKNLWRSWAGLRRRGDSTGAKTGK
jgi:hypothetical protein